MIPLDIPIQNTDEVISVIVMSNEKFALLKSKTIEVYNKDSNMVT